MKPSKFLSRRSAIWFDVDKARCGVPEFIFNNNFGFEEWVDYALNVPMYFVRRNGKYINCAGESFKNFMQGNLKVLQNDVATLMDWEDHLSTIFTEVRLKQFIEFRGADAGPWKNLCALPAIWVGMFYDKNALNEIEVLANSISRESFTEMYIGGPKEGLNLEINGKKLNHYAKDIISIAKNGLKNRAIKDSTGNDESGYLNQLEEIVFSGKNQAKRMLDIWNEDKKNALTKLYETYSY